MSDTAAISRLKHLFAALEVEYVHGRPGTMGSCHLSGRVVDACSCLVKQAREQHGAPGALEAIESLRKSMNNGVIPASLDAFLAPSKNESFEAMGFLQALEEEYVGGKSGALDAFLGSSLGRSIQPARATGVKRFLATTSEKGGVPAVRKALAHLRMQILTGKIALLRDDAGSAAQQPAPPRPGGAPKGSGDSSGNSSKRSANVGSGPGVSDTRGCTGSSRNTPSADHIQEATSKSHLKHLFAALEVEYVHGRPGTMGSCHLSGRVVDACSCLVKQAREQHGAPGALEAIESLRKSMNNGVIPASLDAFLAPSKNESFEAMGFLQALEEEYVGGKSGALDAFLGSSLGRSIQPARATGVKRFLATTSEKGGVPAVRKALAHLRMQILTGKIALLRDDAGSAAQQPAPPRPGGAPKGSGDSSSNSSKRSANVGSGPGVSDTRGCTGSSRNTPSADQVQKTSAAPPPAPSAIESTEVAGFLQALEEEYIGGASGALDAFLGSSLGRSIKLTRATGIRRSLLMTSKRGGVKSVRKALAQLKAEITAGKLSLLCVGTGTSKTKQPDQSTHEASQRSSNSSSNSSSDSSSAGPGVSDNRGFNDRFLDALSSEYVHGQHGAVGRFLSAMTSVRVLDSVLDGMERYVKKQGGEFGTKGAQDAISAMRGLIETGAIVLLPTT